MKCRMEMGQDHWDWVRVQVGVQATAQGIRTRGISGREVSSAEAQGIETDIGPIVSLGGRQAGGMALIHTRERMPARYPKRMSSPSSAGKRRIWNEPLVM